MPLSHNEWPWAATIEAITPLDETAGLVVRAAYVSRPGLGVSGVVGPEPALPRGMTLGQAYATLPARVDPAGPAYVHDATLLLVVSADQPGPIGFSALAVDYRVGPFTFRAIQHTALDGCVGPLPTGTRCASG